MKRVNLPAVLLLAVLIAAPHALAQGSNGPVSFQPGADLLNRAVSPAPGSGATNQSKKAAIGRGNTMIDSGDPKSSFWSEPADLESNGTVAQADMLWDASAKIFYAFAHTTLRCSHGKSTEGDILIGIYGKKNFLGKAAGSGWWVVDLQNGQCQAPLAGLYGCKFDNRGRTLACGRAELDTRINDMAIVESTRF